MALIEGQGRRQGLDDIAGRGRAVGQAFDKGVQGRRIVQRYTADKDAAAEGQGFDRVGSCHRVAVGIGDDHAIAVRTQLREIGTIRLAGDVLPQAIGAMSIQQGLQGLGGRQKSSARLTTVRW